MLFAEWDWIAAERSFQRALAIDPNHAHAYLRYGDLMEALGDLERGFQLKLQGLESPSLGELLAQGKDSIEAWWVSLTTFAVLVGTLVLLIFIGEALHQALDTRRGEA